jgi:hypothetical protein
VLYRPVILERRQTDRRSCCGSGLAKTLLFKVTARLQLRQRPQRRSLQRGGGRGRGGCLSAIATVVASPLEDAANKQPEQAQREGDEEDHDDLALI